MGQILFELRVGGPRNLAGLRSRYSQLWPLVVLAAGERAKPLLGGSRPKLRSAFRAYARVDHADVATTVSIERCSAIGAHDPKVLEAVVASVAVDVVEDQRHQTALPELALTAEFTAPFLQSLLIEAMFQVPPVEARILDHDLLQRPPRSLPRPSLMRIGVEVIRGYAPAGSPLAKSRSAPTAGAHSQPAERLSVGQRAFDDFSRFRLGVLGERSSHANTCSHASRTEGTGGPGFEPGSRDSKGLRLAIRPPPNEGSPTVPPPPRHAA